MMQKRPYESRVDIDTSNDLIAPSFTEQWSFVFLKEFAGSLPVIQLGPYFRNEVIVFAHKHGKQPCLS
jgi:hypothetical protein